MPARVSLFCLLLGLGIGVRAAADRVAEVRRSELSTVLVHAGAFQMGSDDEDVAFAVELCAGTAEDTSMCRPELFADEQPQHRVFLSAFRIDRAEVTRADYQSCVQRGGCPPSRIPDSDARLGRPEQPVTGVTAAEAARYCAWLGGRLPTEAEWERAARGNSRRRFPWGNAWNRRVANHGIAAGKTQADPDGYEFAAPALAFADGKSAYGLLNMAGNVWELTADRYARDAYAKSQLVDPRGANEGDEIAIRGGSWRTPAYALRVTQRATLKQDESRPDVGFRCAYNVP